MSASVIASAWSIVLPRASSTSSEQVAVPKPQPVVKYEMSSITSPGPTFRKYVYMSPHESLKYSPVAVGFSIVRKPVRCSTKLLKLREIHDVVTVALRFGAGSARIFEPAFGRRRLRALACE